jgi:hypothetical protein
MPLWRESDDGRCVTAYPEGAVARDGEAMWMPERRGGEAPGSTDAVASVEPDDLH